MQSEIEFKHEQPLGLVKYAMKLSQFRCMGVIVVTLLDILVISISMLLVLRTIRGGVSIINKFSLAGFCLS